MEKKGMVNMMNKKFMALMLGTAMTLSSASGLMVSANTTQMAAQKTAQKTAEIGRAHV